MKAYLQDNKQFKHGKIPYSLEEFQLSQQDVRS